MNPLFLFDFRHILSSPNPLTEGRHLWYPWSSTQPPIPKHEHP